MYNVQNLYLHVVIRESILAQASDSNAAVQAKVLVTMPLAIFYFLLNFASQGHCYQLHTVFLAV